MELLELHLWLIKIVLIHGGGMGEAEIEIDLYAIGVLYIKKRNEMK